MNRFLLSLMILWTKYEVGRSQQLEKSDSYPSSSIDCNESLTGISNQNMFIPYDFQVWHVSVGLVTFNLTQDQEVNLRVHSELSLYTSELEFCCEKYQLLCCIDCRYQYIEMYLFSCNHSICPLEDDLYVLFERWSLIKLNESGSALDAILPAALYLLAIICDDENQAPEWDLHLQCFLPIETIDIATSTMNPNIPSSEPTSGQPVHTVLTIIVTVSGFVVIICVFSNIIRCILRRKSRRPPTNHPKIRNAFVVGLGIGEYQSSAISDAGTLENLSVGKDLDNLESFCTFMGYEFMCSDRKTEWTKEEIFHYLQDDVGAAFFTAKRRARYDGLLVCVSGHGVQGHVVTSGLEHIGKTAICRCICEKYPEFIDIPRIFIFDTCGGSRERQSIVWSIGGDESNEMGKPKGDVKQHIIAMHSDEMSGDMMPKDNPADIEGDIGKAGGSKKANRWSSVGSNLDRNTAVIHAANEGYQAKMRGDVGSYLLYSFISAVRQDIADHTQKGLAELMEDVQNGLHRSGRQQTVNVFNGEMRNLRLEIKTNKNIF